MNRPRHWRYGALATVVFAGVLGSAGDADASGYLTARFGADHGSPAHPNAFAIYFNPAALGGTKGTSLTGDVSVLLRFARYNRTAEALSPSDPSSLQNQQYVSANTGVATLTNLLALPFLGVNTDFGGSKYLRAGWAAYVPFGGLATWTRTSGTPGVPGSSDGVQRWHNISGQILAIYNTFAFAVTLPDTKQLSFGVSVSPVIHNAATVRARNGDGSDDTISNGSLQEGRSLVNATGVNLAASAGVYVEPTKDLRLGLSYISQPGFGQTRMGGELKTQLGSGQESKTDIDLLQTLPDVIRLGGAFKTSRELELRADFEFVRWSVFKRQCLVDKGADCNVNDDGGRLPGPEGQKVILNVPRNWNNAIGVRAGPGYWINDQLEAFGSLGLTTSAVPKETIDASTIDSTRLYLTFGAKYEVSKSFTIAGSYNHIYFFPVNTNGRSTQNLENHPATQPGGGDYNVSRSPSSDGRYQSQIGFVNINAAYTF